MHKNYNINNINGDTFNDEKKCSLTDMNCLGQDEEKSRSDSKDRADYDEDGKGTSVNLKDRGTLSGQSGDSLGSDSSDNMDSISDKNR